MAWQGESFVLTELSLSPTKLQPTPVFLPGESQGRWSLPGELLSMGSHRVGHDSSDLAAAACKREHNFAGMAESVKTFRSQKSICT